MARPTAEKDAARQLRREQTDAEYVMWSVLRDRKLLNMKFHGQHPIGNYIADFCCVEKGLIIEHDGSQHLERAQQDAERTKCLSDHGFTVLRFANGDVLPDPEGAVEAIRLHVLKTSRRGALTTNEGDT